MTIDADIARLKIALPEEAFSILQAEYGAQKAGGRGALKAAMAKVKESFAYRSGTWAKRAAEDAVPTPYVAIECPQCAAVQPECCCAACGRSGPGAYCYRCSMAVRSMCPGCSNWYRPVLLEEDAEASMRSMEAVVSETRSAKGVGEIVLWCNSDRKDSWGTVIPPEILIQSIDKDTGVDIEHNRSQVPGVSIADVHLAKRHVEGKLATGVSFKYVCDLTKPPAESFHRAFVDGVRKGASVWIDVTKRNSEAVKKGITDTLSEIVRCKWLSAVANPANDAATVFEFRSKAIAGELPAKTEPKPGDPLASLRETVAAIGGGDSESAQRADSQTTPPSKEGGNPESETVESLARRLDSAMETIEQLRAAAPSKEWEPGLAALTDRAQQTEGHLHEVLAAVKEAKELHVDLASVTRAGLDGLQSFMKAKVRQLEEVIAKLAAPGPRNGTTGAEIEDLAPELRKQDEERQVNEEKWARQERYRQSNILKNAMRG